MRNWISFSPVGDRELYERKLYGMASQCKHAAVLTDKYPFYNGHAQQYHEFDLLAGFDALDLFQGDFDALERGATGLNDWLLGYFSYGLANQVEPGVLTKMTNDKFDFGPLSFFRPRYLIRKQGGNWYLGYDSKTDTPASGRQFLAKINALPMDESVFSSSRPDFKGRASRAQYLQAVSKLKEHIRRGDIYEINYCFELFSEDATINPVAVFDRLMGVSPMPFGVFYKQNDSYLIGASPERYLRKRGARILSQPMKGTIQRGRHAGEDLQVMRGFLASEKERAENIMIADLVRNDLSRVAARGTVRVDELCGIFSYPGLYQMVSTISAQMHPDAVWLAPLKAAFPMGSMTGAPKIKAMQLIDRYELSPRGLYSGAVGYITPELDYDFNVVIRSFLYNEATRYLSYSVGSAITAGCNPEEEYRECLLKAGVLKKVFGPNKIKHESIRG